MTSIDPNSAQAALFEKLGLTQQSDAQKANSDKLGQSDFLKLMTTQLQNQDPFAPMDNGDFIAQMAQFSTVTGIQEMNTSIGKLVGEFDQARIATASNLLGHSVLVPGNIGRADENGELHGVLDLPDSTILTQLTYRDADTNAELYMEDLLLSVALTGFLASLVYAISSFSQVLVGWLIDRMSPRKVLFIVSTGQIIFIYLASQFDGYKLFFLMTLAVCFVFGQIPIIDAVMVRYVPDNWRNRVLSMKFVLNLGVGATVLPTCSFMLEKGYQLSDLFSFLSLFSIVIVLASILLPSQSPALNSRKFYKEI